MTNEDINIPEMVLCADSGIIAERYPGLPAF